MLHVVKSMLLQAGEKVVVHAEAAQFSQPGDAQNTSKVKERFRQQVSVTQYKLATAPVLLLGNLSNFKAINHPIISSSVFQKDTVTVVLSGDTQKTPRQAFLKSLQIASPLDILSLALLSYLRFAGSYQTSTSPSILEMQLPSNVSSSRLTQDSKPSILERLLLLNDAHFKFSNFSRFVISKRCCPSKFKAVIYTIIHITCYF